MIEIDEAKCDGCGDCLPNCPEGALQIINGKARVVSESMCDGLGACVQHCPQNAITIREKEAAPYDARQVIAKAAVPHPPSRAQASPSGCPGSRSLQFNARPTAVSRTPSSASALTHWPIQLHLAHPLAPHFQKADLLLAADCTAFAAGDFHSAHLRGKTLVIGCPKLDDHQEVYLAKLKTLIDQAGINTLTVMIMEVPCCGGLLHLAREAARQAKRSVPIKLIRVGLQGDILEEEWMKG